MQLSECDFLSVANINLSHEIKTAKVKTRPQEFNLITLRTILTKFHNGLHIVGAENLPRRKSGCDKGGRC